MLKTPTIILPSEVSVDMIAIALLTNPRLDTERNPTVALRAIYACSFSVNNQNSRKKYSRLLKHNQIKKNSVEGEPTYDEEEVRVLSNQSFYVSLPVLLNATESSTVLAGYLDMC